METGMAKEWLDLFDLKIEPLGALNLGTKEEPRVFGEKNATKVCEALERAKSLPLARWLLALGIEDAGETISYEIAKLHDDLEEVAKSKVLEGIARLGSLYDELGAVSPFARNENKPKDEKEKAERVHRTEELKAEIETLGQELEKAGAARLNENSSKYLTVIGPKVARNIVDYFASESGKKAMARLRKLGINPKSNRPSRAESASPISGKTFVLTGTLPTMTRDQATAEIRARGGTVTGSVSKNTDYVLAGAEAGSKLEKAKTLGIDILDEAQFLKLCGKR